MSQLPVDGGGSVLVASGGSECSTSFPLETFFSFGALGAVTFVVPRSVG